MDVEPTTGGSPPEPRAGLSPAALAVWVAVAAACFFGAVVLRRLPSEPGRREPVSGSGKVNEIQRTPGVPSTVRALEERVAARERPIGERLDGIQQLAHDPHEGPAAIGRLLESIAPETSDAQVRASLLTALGAFPEDARAQAELTRALDPGRAREERILALAVIATLPRAEWAAGPVERLTQDGDEAVRAKAKSTLDRIRTGVGHFRQ